MSSNYYDMNGILKLKELTPIINALFSSHDVKPEAVTEKGITAYIAEMSETNSPNWTDICESLQSIKNNLGIALRDDADDIDTVRTFLSHYQYKGAATFEFNDGDAPGLDELFELAIAMDDGHGIEAICIEGCWHAGKARLFEFGGHAEYFGKQFEYSAGSTGSANFASSVDSHLAENDLAGANALIMSRVLDIFNGIKDEGKREKLMQTLAEALTPSAPEEEDSPSAPRA